MEAKNMPPDPHAHQPLLTAGPAPEQAPATLILLHGRGASAQSVMALHKELDIARLSAIAPQAAGSTWYPQSFLAPIDSNQPYLGSALRRIAQLRHRAVSRHGP